MPNTTKKRTAKKKPASARSQMKVQSMVGKAASRSSLASQIGRSLSTYQNNTTKKRKK